MSDSTQVIHLPATMRDDIVAHAREEAPRECCGIIAGKNGVLTKLYRMVNLYDGIDFYEIDGWAILKLSDELDARGEEISVIYHSHPVSVAYPSVRDVENAGWPDSVYVICSLEHPEVPVLRAFRMVDGTIREVEIAD